MILQELLLLLKILREKKKKNAGGTLKDKHMHDLSSNPFPTVHNSHEPVRLPTLI